MNLRLAASRSITFKQCAAEYIKAHGAGWRNAKHRHQWENTLATYAELVTGALPVASVDMSLALKILEPIRTTKQKPQLGSVAALKAFSIGPGSAATAREKPRPVGVATWTSSWCGCRSPEGPAHATLPYDEMPVFMTKLRAEEGMAARALELLVLTLARTGEVIGARKPETISGRRSGSCRLSA